MNGRVPSLSGCRQQRAGEGDRRSAPPLDQRPSGGNHDAQDAKVEEQMNGTEMDDHLRERRRLDARAYQPVPYTVEGEPHGLERQRDSNPCLSCAEFSPISPGSYEGAPIVLTAQAQTRRLFARPRAVSGDLGTDSNVLFESCRLGQPRGLRRAEPALSNTGPEASNEVHADHDAP